MKISAQVISLTGRVIGSAKSQGEGFSIGNNLPNGIYMIKVDFDNNIFTQKVILK